MKFFCEIKGSNLVWDTDKDRLLCTFKNGVLEIEDEYVINKLINSGYDYEVVEKVSHYVQLKREAKALKINTYGMKIPEIEKALEEAKGFKELEEEL